MQQVFWILSIPAALALIGFLYYRVGAYLDQLRFAGSGRFVKIDQALRLYIFEQGPAETVQKGAVPTVIFESGIAATNLNWGHVQASVAQFAPTLSYDRAGLGWSSSATTPRTPANVASELRIMLQSAGIKPPYILVAHSFGGLVMRRYAELYPEDVSGVVLVDPMRIEEWPPLNSDKQAYLNRGSRMARLAMPIASVGLARLAATSLLCRSGKLSDYLAGAAGDGGLHVLRRIKGEVSKMPREVWPMVAAHWSRPAYYAGMRAHIRAVPDTVREMMTARPISGIPVLLLTPEGSSPVTQEQMDRMGDNVRQVFAPASAHWIHLDEPDLVIESIREMVLAGSVSPSA